MTEQEFLRLCRGTVVTDGASALRREKEPRYFVIYDEDVMGSAHRGKEHAVYAAEQFDSEDHVSIRIDRQNARFWEIAGHMKEEDIRSVLDWDVCDDNTGE